MFRILLIDDDDLLRGVLAKSLTYAGHHVIQAVDGQQGVELARAAAPLDLVITDLVMPKQEGVETIAQLKREYPAVPVIAISGGLSHSKLYLDIAAKMGARRVLAKPFSPQELMQVIDEVMRETGDRKNGEAS